MPVRMPAPSGNFTPPPEGTFIGVCYRVIDLGTQETSFKGQAKHQRLLLLSWELPDELMDDGRPFIVNKRYTYSSSPKSNLRKDLESWRGKKFTDSEIEGFDVAALLSVGCMLNISHTDKDGTIYANIGAIVRLPKGTKTPFVSNDLLALSLDDRPFDWAAFGGLGERLQEVIKRAPEYDRAIKDLPAQDDRPFDWAAFGGLGERLQEVIKRAPEYDRAIKDLPAQDDPPPASEGDYGGDLAPF